MLKGQSFGFNLSTLDSPFPYHVSEISDTSSKEVKALTHKSTLDESIEM